MIAALLARAGITQAFAALRRKDLSVVMNGWADDGVFEFPGRSAMSGRYEGKAAIRAFWERVFPRMETFDMDGWTIGADVATMLTGLSMLTATIVWVLKGA